MLRGIVCRGYKWDNFSLSCCCSYHSNLQNSLQMKLFCFFLWLGYCFICGVTSVLIISSQDKQISQSQLEKKNLQHSCCQAYLVSTPIASYQLKYYYNIINSELAYWARWGTLKKVVSNLISKYSSMSFQIILQFYSVQRRLVPMAVYFK